MRHRGAHLTDWLSVSQVENGLPGLSPSWYRAVQCRGSSVFALISYRNLINAPIMVTDKSHIPVTPKRYEHRDKYKEKLFFQSDM